jgi:hypothetical protein
VPAPDEADELPFARFCAGFWEDTGPDSGADSGADSWFPEAAFVSVTALAGAVPAADGCLESIFGVCSASLLGS